MPLEQPTRSNGFSLHADHKHNIALWQPILNEIKSGLDSLDETAEDWEAALATQSTEIAAAIFDELIAPQLQEMQDELAALLVEIGAAGDALAAINAAGVNAVNVTIDPAIDGLTAVKMDAAIAEMVAEDSNANAAIAAIIAAGPVDFVSITDDLTLIATEVYQLRAIASKTLTLPATPTDGDELRVIDGESITDLITYTIDGNGEDIMGSSDDYIMNKSGSDLVFWFNGTEWRIKAGPSDGTSGSSGSYASTLKYS